MPGAYFPASRATPPGFFRLDRRTFARQALLVVSFTSRVAIANGHSYYYLNVFFARRCYGVIHGDVSLVITTGPTAPSPSGPLPGQSVGREVGHFAISVP